MTYALEGTCWVPVADAPRDCYPFQLRDDDVLYVPLDNHIQEDIE